MICLAETFRLRGVSLQGSSGVFHSMGSPVTPNSRTAPSCTLKRMHHVTDGYYWLIPIGCTATWAWPSRTNGMVRIPSRSGMVVVDPLTVM